MRYALLLLIAPALLATGCSICVAKAGKDLSHIKTRQDAHTEFGAPMAEGIDDGKPFEEFRTRSKIAEQFRAGTHSMALGMTMGLYELYLFPRELYFLAKCGLIGQTVRVTYNPDGSVRTYSIDDRWAGVVHRTDAERPKSEATIPPPEDVLTPTVQRMLDEKRGSEK